MNLSIMTIVAAILGSTRAGVYQRPMETLPLPRTGTYLLTLQEVGQGQQPIFGVKAERQQK